MITPDVEHISGIQFNRAEECIKKGREAARTVLPEIRVILKSGKESVVSKKYQDSHL